uniref:Uncharacterized protein n=1 Tax=Oryza barthii TaxID=65489 RepID=A0A0D3GGZ0_9ORYZ
MASGSEDLVPSSMRSSITTLSTAPSTMMEGRCVHPIDDVQRGDLQRLGAGDGGVNTGSPSSRADRPPSNIIDEMVPKYRMAFESYESAYAFYEKAGRSRRPGKYVAADRSRTYTGGMRLSVNIVVGRLGAQSSVDTVTLGREAHEIAQASG